MSFVCCCDVAAKRCPSKYHSRGKNFCDYLRYVFDDRSIFTLLALCFHLGLLMLCLTNVELFLTPQPLLCCCETATEHFVSYYKVTLSHLLVDAFAFQVACMYCDSEAQCVSAARFIFLLFVGSVFDRTF